jgi:hypothetical protein
MPRKFVMSDTKRAALEAAVCDALWCDVQPGTYRESWFIENDDDIEASPSVAWQTVYSLLRARPPLIETYTPAGMQNCKCARLTDAGRAMLEAHDEAQG